MQFRSVIFLCVFALTYAKNCPSNKRINSKLICYYSKVADIDPCYCTHVVLPADADLKSVASLRQKLAGVKILLTVNEFNQGLVKTVKQNHIDGLELSLKKLDSKDDITEFISTVRTKLGNDLYLALSVPSKTELLAKYYDLKALTKSTDLFILQTAFLGASKNVTFHPSRLSGLWDMQNTDSVVDLITGLGAPLSRLVIAAPVQAFSFRLQDSSLTTPGSPALELRTITRRELCKKMNSASGEKDSWTLERDQDQAGPYIFRDTEWIAFEDATSMDIKAKYARVRGLAGLALKDVSQDANGAEGCNPLLAAAHAGLAKQTRAPRGAVLRSLEREILDTPSKPLETVHVSPFRITRVVDVEGHVHSIRKDTRTEFECTRQGYFVHPHSCGRFYRCVKFDQLSDEFSVFEFDCPAGLAFDERVEVCVWPGSLKDGAPCAGSSEIAPVPRHRFTCPEHPGYYADPENCRWFFACLDHGESGLTAYEFRCPFGLVFDEKHLICEWPWLVTTCVSGYVSGLELDSVYYYGGASKSTVVLGTGNVQPVGVRLEGHLGGLAAGAHILDTYNGLGQLGTVALGGYSGDINALKQSVALGYDNGQSGIGVGSVGLVHESGVVGTGGPSVILLQQGVDAGKLSVIGSGLAQNGYIHQGGLGQVDAGAGSIGAADLGLQSHAGNLELSKISIGEASLVGGATGGLSAVEYHGNTGKSGGAIGQVQLETPAVEVNAGLGLNSGDGLSASDISHGSALSQENAEFDVNGGSIGVIQLGPTQGGSITDHSSTVQHGTSSYNTGGNSALKIGGVLQGASLQNSAIFHGSQGLNSKVNVAGVKYTNVDLGSAGDGLASLGHGLGELNYGTRLEGSKLKLYESAQGVVDGGGKLTGSLSGAVLTADQDYGTKFINTGSKLATSTVQLHGNTGLNYDDQQKTVLLATGGTVGTDRIVGTGEIIGTGGFVSGIVSTGAKIAGTLLTNIDQGSDKFSLVNTGSKTATSTVQLHGSTGLNYDQEKVLLLGTGGVVNSGPKVSGALLTTVDQGYGAKGTLLSSAPNLATSTVEIHGNAENIGQKSVLLNGGIDEGYGSKLTVVNSGPSVATSTFTGSHGLTGDKAVLLDSGAKSAVSYQGSTIDHVNGELGLTGGDFYKIPIREQGTVLTGGYSVAHQSGNYENVGQGKEGLALFGTVGETATSTVNLNTYEGGKYGGLASLTDGSFVASVNKLGDNVGLKPVLLNGGSVSTVEFQESGGYKSGSGGEDLQVVQHEIPAQPTVQVHGQPHSGSLNYNYQYANEAQYVQPAVSHTFTSHAASVGGFDKYNSDTVVLNTPKLKYNVQAPTSITYGSTLTHNIGLTANDVSTHGGSLYGESILTAQPVEKLDSNLTAVNYATNYLAVTPKTDIVTNIKLGVEKYAVPVGEIKQTAYSNSYHYQAPITPVALHSAKIQPQTYGVQQTIVPVAQQPVLLSKVETHVTPTYESQFYGKSFEEVNLPAAQQPSVLLTKVPTYETQFYGKKVEEVKIPTVQSSVLLSKIQPQVETVSAVSEFKIPLIQKPSAFKVTLPVESISVTPKYETQYSLTPDKISTSHQQSILLHQPAVKVETPISVTPAYETTLYGKKIEESVVPIVQKIQTPVSVTPLYETQFYGKKIQESVVPIVQKVQTDLLPIKTVVPTYQTGSIGSTFYGKYSQESIPVQTFTAGPSVVNSYLPAKEVVTNVKYEAPKRIVNTVYVSSTPKPDIYLYPKVSEVFVSSTPKYEALQEFVQPQQTFEIKKTPFVNTAHAYGAYSYSYGKQIQHPVVSKPTVVESYNYLPAKPVETNIKYEAPRPIVNTAYVSYTPKPDIYLSPKAPEVFVSSTPKYEALQEFVQPQQTFEIKKTPFVNTAQAYGAYPYSYGKQIQHPVVSKPTVVESYNYLPAKPVETNIKYEAPRPIVNTAYVSYTPKPDIYLSPKAPEVFVSSTPKYEALQEFVQPQQTFEIKKTPFVNTAQAYGAYPYSYGKQIQHPVVSKPTVVESYNYLPAKPVETNIKYEAPRPIVNTAYVSSTPKPDIYLSPKAPEIFVSSTPKYEALQEFVQPQQTFEIKKTPVVNTAQAYGAYLYSYGKQFQHPVVSKPTVVESYNYLPAKPIETNINYESREYLPPNPVYISSTPKPIKYSPPKQSAVYLSSTPKYAVFQEFIQPKQTFEIRKTVSPTILTVTPRPTVVESYSYLPPKPVETNVRFESRKYLPPKPTYVSSTPQSVYISSTPKSGYISSTPRPVYISSAPEPVYISSTPRPNVYVQPEVFVSTTPKYRVFQEFIQPKQTFEIKKTVVPTILTAPTYETYSVPKQTVEIKKTRPTIVESYSIVQPKPIDTNIRFESREYLPPKPVYVSSTPKPLYISSTLKPTVYLPPKQPEIYVSTTPKYGVFQEFVQPQQTFEIRKTVAPTVVNEYKFENAAYANFESNLNLPNIQAENVYSTPRPILSTVSSGVLPVKSYQTEYVVSTPRPTFISTIAPIVKQTPTLRAKVVAINKYTTLDDKVIVSTPKPLYISSAAPIITAGVQTNDLPPFKYYDSRLQSTTAKLGIGAIDTDVYDEIGNYGSYVTTPKPILSTLRPVQRTKFVSTSAVPLDTYSSYVDDGFGTQFVVPTRSQVVASYRPDRKKIVSTTAVPLDLGAGYVDGGYNSEYVVTTARPKVVSTIWPVLRKKIVSSTTAAPLDAYSYDYVVPEIKPIVATTLRPIISRKKLVATTTSLPVVDYEDLSLKSTYEPVKVITPRPKGKTVVRVNDFHPFLTTKLGAQCTCVSNTLKLRKPSKTRTQVVDYDYSLPDNVPVTKLTSAGPTSFDNNEPGVYLVESSGVSDDFGYEPRKVVTVTNSPEVFSTTNAVHPAPTPSYTLRKTVTSVRPIEPDLYISSTPATAIAEDIFLKKSLISSGKTKEEKIAEAVNEGLSLVKSAIKGYVKEAVGEEIRKFDRYGPGGWRSRDETLQGTVDCKRAGLFRHPTQCNKFYACHWDCTKQRYTLHVFNCPVHLTFDSTQGACNWPSKGPACADNTLLPSA